MHHTDPHDHRILPLQRELKRTKLDFQRTKWRFLDAKWALYELTNGAANPAIHFNSAGELLDHVDYTKRGRIGEIVWGAVAAMKSSQQ